MSTEAIKKEIEKCQKCHAYFVEAGKLCKNCGGIEPEEIDESDESDE